ncbi:PQQ-dependent sugar dehydrogenase [Terriglobus aquaticus]|uniref:PQQ-dependent sugar dehydrogenase n=1 Tax=Terriglobus aquaticus TaxID=940139 RepID=A0ABW9KN51_9BACT|nr:PQQ-dependent sugar dehydrogenase [Terriglobus aquaticus]
MRRPRLSALLILPLAATLVPALASAQQTQVKTGQSAFEDALEQKPGNRIHITTADLPVPHEEESVDNGPTISPRNGAVPQVPAGYKVELYSEGDWQQPRLARTAPNGDIFVADSKAGKIYVLRGVGPDGKAQQKEVFASVESFDSSQGKTLPFGINFYPAVNPKWVYVANTINVVKFPYKAGDLHASGPAEIVVKELPGFAQLRGGGHWTRDVVFSKDGTRMFVSVGSRSNVDDTDNNPGEFHRADVLEYKPDGTFVKVYASGIRNCVGEAINPITGSLWCSTNERDRLGNHLVPDYITSVQEGGFYGWPWYYMSTDGGVQDPRHVGKHPELKGKVITPDVLVQPHMASLEMLFYPNARGAGAFPAAMDGDIFAAEHGSWNRKNRAGYEVVHAFVRDGKATGEYEDFVTGFVTPDGKVWGRPVGVTVGKDGALYIVEDGANTMWRVTYTGNRQTASK